MQTNHPELRQAFSRARQERKARHRDIAQELNISEGELLAAHVGSFGEEESPLQAIRLAETWTDQMKSFEAMGDVLALTRNDSCVHEKVGTYRKVSHNDGIGLVLGGAIDLRVFYHRWAHGFAVTERLADGARQRSLQYFDAAGEAIHKIFLRPESDIAAYDALVARFQAEDQNPGMTPGTAWQEPEEQGDDTVDVAAFHQDWAGLQDTHDFFGMLRKHGLSRTQAFRLGDPTYVQPLPVTCVADLLNRAAERQVSFMVFAGNPGMIQIHTGPVQRVVAMGPWLNVLDPGFNLHLRSDHVASAWLVRKPTSDGIVTSLELFDAHGRNIAMLYGERKPGQPEHEDWRALLQTLLDDAATGTQA